MTTATAILALLLSVASLVFSVYQYRILHKVRVSEKASAILRFAYDLRRKSQDLKHLIDCTDDVDDCDELLAKTNAMVETELSKVAISKGISLDILIEIEQKLLSAELEIDLLHKQIAEHGRFNKEVRDYETRRMQQHEA